MYKKLVCILLLISITLTACDRGAGNNVGGTPITKNKVVSNAPTTKPAVNAIFDYKSGEYRFSYSYNDNFGVLENSLAYKGEYYFMPTSILWIDANGKIKVLSNINLNKIQLSSYQGFIDLVQQTEREFQVVYPNSVVTTVIPATMEQFSKKVYMNTTDTVTGKNQLLGYNPSNGTVEIIQDKIDAIGYGYDTIIALRIVPTKGLLKKIDLSNNIVTDGGTFPLNISLRNNAQDKDSILASVDNVGSNMSNVLITYNESANDADGESSTITIDQSYLCNTKDKTYTNDIQILSVSSTFKVNDSVPRGVKNLFYEYAKSHSLSINNINSSLNHKGNASEINWTHIGIITGVTILFAILGGLWNYHSRSKNFYEKNLLFEMSQHEPSNDNMKKFDFVKAGDKFFLMDDFISNKAQTELLFEHLSKNPQIVEDLKSVIANLEPTSLNYNKTQENIKYFQEGIKGILEIGQKIPVEDWYSKASGITPITGSDSYLRVKFSSSDNYDKDLLLNSASKEEFNLGIDKYNETTDIQTKRDILKSLIAYDGNSRNPISAYLRDMHEGIKISALKSLYEKMKADKTTFNAFLVDKIPIIETRNNIDPTFKNAIIEKLHRRSMVKLAWGGLVGLGGIAITEIYFGFFDQKFDKTVIISDPACIKTGNCIIGTVYDSNKQVINDEKGNPAMIGSGYIQDAYFTVKGSKNNYALRFYHLSNNMSCQQLNTNFKTSKSTILPTFIEVKSDNKTQMLPILDGDGNICNISNEVLNSTITLVKY